MVRLFYDNYLIFNTNVNIINNHIIEKPYINLNINQVKEKIENSDLIKILQSKIEYDKVDNYFNILISFFLLYNNDLLSNERTSLIKYIKTKDNNYFHNEICEIYEAFSDLKLNYKDIAQQLMVDIVSNANTLDKNSENGENSDFDEEYEDYERRITEFMAGLESDD